MRLPAWIAWRDLWAHRRQAVALGAVFAAAVTAFVTLGAYRDALVRDYPAAQEEQLVVQETQSFGEFYGSRLSPDVAHFLDDLGVANPIPEIHAIVGTSLEDAVLLKGVDLGNFAAIDSFIVRNGRSLRPGDAPRTAMIGMRLAERLELESGDVIRLRGRAFDVVGVFETGSYAENEAWVPLAGAQGLLGWEQDVSLYVVPAGGAMRPGALLREGVSVAGRGELWSTFPRQWEGLMALIGTVTQAIGLEAVLSLAAMLWRLAWRRRRQIAILRSVGFGRSVAGVYLAAQGAMITLMGGAAGVLAAMALLRWARPTLGGVSLRPYLTADVLLSTGLWLVILMVFSVVVPASLLGRTPVAEIVSAE